MPLPHARDRLPAPRRRRALPLFVVALLLAACGGSTDAAGDATGTQTTATDADTATAGGLATTGSASTGTPGAAAGAPQRIVSLSPTATEVLFAIGAGDRVVAAEEFSTYPEEAPTTDLSGFEPNLEAITEYDPDLVVAMSDPGDLVEGLDAVGVDTLIQPAPTDLEGAYDQIEQLGAAVGNELAASEVVADMQTQIDDVVASAPEAELTYYHELDPNYFSVTGDTFIGDVYERLGLTSIADGAEGAASGYPQLSAEYVLEADPDLILLADTKCCDVTPESVAQRPGWEQLTAVQQERLVPLDDDVASRWGPRIVDLMAQVADVAAEAAAAQPAGTGA